MSTRRSRRVTLAMRSGALQPSQPLRVPPVPTPTHTYPPRTLPASPGLTHLHTYTPKYYAPPPPAPSPPQVNTLVLWVGISALNGYHLGLKLELRDSEAWRWGSKLCRGQGAGEGKGRGRGHGEVRRGGG